jgi:hypothetical protein
MLSTENHSIDFPKIKRPVYEAQSPLPSVYSLWILELHLHTPICLHGVHKDDFTCFAFPTDPSLLHDTRNDRLLLAVTSTLCTHQKP